MWTADIDQVNHKFKGRRRSHVDGSVLCRRLRFRLERGASEPNLLDRSGCTLKMEPLASIGQLEKFLLRMVAKQWFDYDRTTFRFIRQATSVASGECAPIELAHQSHFDENGLMYWIGTNARTAPEWVNPGKSLYGSTYALHGAGSMSTLVLRCSQCSNLSFLSTRNHLPLTLLTLSDRVVSSNLLQPNMDLWW